MEPAHVEVVEKAVYNIIANCCDYNHEQRKALCRVLRTLLDFSPKSVINSIITILETASNDDHYLDVALDAKITRNVQHYVNEIFHLCTGRFYHPQPEVVLSLTLRNPRANQTMRTIIRLLQLARDRYGALMKSTSSGTFEGPTEVITIELLAQPLSTG